MMTVVADKNVSNIIRQLYDKLRPQKNLLGEGYRKFLTCNKNIFLLMGRRTEGKQVYKRLYSEKPKLKKFQDMGERGHYKSK